MDTSAPLQPKRKFGKARSVCWTLNNYTDADVAALRLYAGECKYLVFGYEVAPTTGTPHLQGYVAWDNSRSVDKFMTIFKTKGVHVELTQGSARQASEYCKYEDYPENQKPNKYEEFGKLPVQGGRMDWERALRDLETGATILDVVHDQPHMAVYQRSLRDLKGMMLKPKHREVNVIVLIGNAGTGKTRYAYDNYPDLYSKPRGDWWDGYTGQETILLDDYYGYLPYSLLLNVLDRYPLQVPIKGGFVHAQWDTVIITSNKPPTQWYREGLTPALRRRLNNIFLVTNTNEETELTPWNPPPPSQSSPPSRSTSCTDDPHA